jgi:hypothetical protein
MVSDNKTEDIVCWNERGDAFVVKNEHGLYSFAFAKQWPAVMHMHVIHFKCSVDRICNEVVTSILSTQKFLFICATGISTIIPYHTMMTWPFIAHADGLKHCHS